MQILFEWFLGVVSFAILFFGIAAVTIDTVREIRWSEMLFLILLFVALGLGVSTAVEILRPSATDQRLVAVRAPAWFERISGGIALVTAPNEARQYEGFPVTLTLVGQRTPSIPAGASSSPVGMTPRMRAELLGGDFEVEEKGVREQQVSRNEPTVWTWRVKSDWPGERLLRVRADALAHVNGVETPRMYDVAERQVKIRVNFWEFLQRNWQYVVGTILLPMAFFAAKDLFKRNKG